MTEFAAPIYVLLLEDHRPLAASVCEYLEHMHMVVDYAQTVQLAKKLLAEQHYNVAVLDINLPDGNGFEVCNYMRTTLGLATPVIMLTARSTLQDKLTGFDAGCDDYLVKPFDMPELVARIQTLAKRERGEVGRNVITVDDLSLSVAERKVMRQGEVIELSGLLFKLLHLLMRESPKPVSKQKITQELWGEEVPDSDSLRSHLYALRKLVDRPFAKPLIQTLSNQRVVIGAYNDENATASQDD